MLDAIWTIAILLWCNEMLNEKKIIHEIFTIKIDVVCKILNVAECEHQALV